MLREMGVLQSDSPLSWYFRRTGGCLQMDVTTVVAVDALCSQKLSEGCGGLCEIEEAVL